MPRRERRSRIKRRRTSLKATNAGPILALSATVLSILGVVALILFVALPALLPKLGISYNPPWQPTPTPQPTARPTPTPHPASVASPAELQHEVVLTGYAEYDWFADPYVWGSRMLFTAGRLVNNSVHMDLLFSYNMDTGEQAPVEATLTNQGYVYPVCNDTWLVYLDAKATGGGVIRAMRLDTGKEVEVKQVYAGQPRLELDGNILAWIERTGTRMDKLFVCDLNTLETATARMFSNTAYGQSAVSMANGEIIYADVDPKAQESGGQGDTSAIYSLHIGKDTTNSYTPGMYVHDPMTNGRQWVWRDGNHGPEDNLYFTQNGAPAKLIAEGIAEYGLSDTFVAYSKNESIFVYFFDDGTTVQITPEVERERTQLLSVSNGAVIWMDVTSRERDVMKYALVK